MMKLKWYGHSCFALTLDDGTVIVTDPFDASVGYPLCDARADVALSSHGHFDHNYFDSLRGDPRIVNTAGVVTLPGATITGVPCWHDDAQGAKRGTNLIFRIDAGGLSVAHLGNLGHFPDSQEQRAALTGLDVMLIPIGGHFTIDTPQALKIVDAFQPRAAIGMHFANRFCHFPITDEQAFLRATGGSVLPNEIELRRGDLAGRFVMEI